MTSWLIFFILCFAGQAFMFFCVLRRQDALLKAMKGDHEQFKVLLRALATRLEATDEVRIETPEPNPEPFSQPLHLSVDEALDAYVRKEREDKRSFGMPDLKF